MTERNHWIKRQSIRKATAAHRLCQLFGISQLGSEECREKLSQLNQRAEQLDTDVYTLQDMIEAISQPLRDYREQFDGPMLRHDVLTLESTYQGDELEGVVRNVVDFGAFVDIGLHEDGLVHVSRRIMHHQISTPVKLYPSSNV